MQSQRWLESVREQLAARRLPRDYIERFMDELADHFCDLTIHNLTEESMQSEQEAIIRLGEPQQVAKAAADAYRRRTFLGRHPVIAFFTFAVSPLFLLLALMLGGFTICGLLSECFGVKDTFAKGVHWERLAELRTGCAMSTVLIILPSILLVVIYYKLAKRTAFASRWLIASSVILSILGYMTHWLCFFNTRFDTEVLALSFGLQKLNAMQLAQFAIPIVLCYWLVRKHRKSGGGETRDLLPQGSKHARAVA